MISEITINIFESSEGGYVYDIYRCAPNECDGYRVSPVDGGLCTTTMENAIEMAAAQATEFIKRDNAKATS